MVVIVTCPETVTTLPTRINWTALAVDELIPEVFVRVGVEVELKTLPPAPETVKSAIVGDVPSTFAPLPVELVTPVPPLATGKAVPLKLIAKVPDVVTGEPATLKNAGTVAATLVTVPPLEGEVLAIVKLGYVPVVDIPVPAVKDTVWSGAVLVIVRVPLVVIGLPDTEMPVPALAATLVTEPLLLNVVQSVLVRYPFTLVVAAGIAIVGVTPPDDVIGLVAETELT